MTGVFQSFHGSVENDSSGKGTQVPLVDERVFTPSPIAGKWTRGNLDVTTQNSRTGSAKDINLLSRFLTSNIPNIPKSTDNQRCSFPVSFQTASFNLQQPLHVATEFVDAIPLQLNISCCVHHILDGSRNPDSQFLWSMEAIPIFAYFIVCSYIYIYIHEKCFTRFLLTLPPLLKTKTETFYFCVRIVRYFCMNDSAWQSLYDWEIWEFSFPAFVLLVLSEATTSRKSWKAISCCSNREKVCLCHVERRLLLI